MRRQTTEKGLFTDEDFTRKFPFESVFETLYGGGVLARGLPCREEYTPEITDLFRKLLLKGSLNSEEYNGATIHHCHRRGWLYAEHSPGNRYWFSSPLHASCISWMITANNKPPDFKSVLELSIAAVKKFKRSQLSIPIRRIGPVDSSFTRPLEAQYQDEL